MSNRGHPESRSSKFPLGMIDRSHGRDLEVDGGYLSQLRELHKSGYSSTSLWELTKALEVRNFWKSEECSTYLVTKLWIRANQLKHSPLTPRDQAASALQHRTQLRNTPPPFSRRFPFHASAFELACSHLDLVRVWAQRFQPHHGLSHSFRAKTYSYLRLQSAAVSSLDPRRSGARTSHPARTQEWYMREAWIGVKKVQQEGKT